MNPSTSLELSLLALCGVLAIESFALQALLDEVQRCRTHLASPMLGEVRREGQRRDKIPAFSVVLYPSGATLTAEALPVTSHVMLFLHVDDVRIETPSSMAMLVSYLLGKVEGRVYVLVRGEHKDARWLDEHFGLQAAFGERMRLALDANGQLAKDLAITRSPRAVLVGADGRIQKVGWPKRRTGREVTGLPHDFMQSMRAR